MKKLPDKKKEHKKAEKTSLNAVLPTIATICFLLCAVVFCLELNAYLRLQRELKVLVAQPPQIEWYDDAKSTQNFNETKQAVETTFSATGNVSENIAAQTSASVERQTVLSSENKTDNTYVLNTKSKKIHKPTCRYAQSMSEENKQTIVLQNADELLKDGYSYCKVCFKEKK